MYTHIDKKINRTQLNSQAREVFSKVEVGGKFIHYYLYSVLEYPYKAENHIYSVIDQNKYLVHIPYITYYTL